MADDWDRIFETFKPPWKIKRHTSGNYRIEDQNGRVLLWVYPKGNDRQNHKKPSEEEALTIVKAIAKMSKRGKP
jgi:hypothetical protein